MTGSHRTLGVTSRSHVEVRPRSAPRAPDTPAWEQVRDLFRNDDSAVEMRVREFLYPSVLVPRLPELHHYAAESFPRGRPLLEAVLDLMQRMFSDFVFDPKATTVATTMGQVIKNRRGVCQDFAHFQIGCLRALGLPARYVSGYLETLPPPGKPKLLGSDASHAWVQLFVPDVGWVDLDPTNNLLPGDRHITVAVGRDFEDVSPIRGVIVSGGKHQLTVAVDVTPVTEVVENG